ncbi:MAG: CheR family methyltransferase [Bacteroidia bacterium]
MSEVKPSSPIQPFIISIGTSAGGLETLRNLFRGIPANLNFAYVVVQHLSPDHKSLMAELLAPHANMPVIPITDQLAATGGNIYLMPPKHLLGISEGVFKLTWREKSPNLNFPIDLFFKELANDQPEKAVAVILSGTGSDGTRGIKAIKEAGGVVIVQDPAEAKFNGMPLNAIATHLADMILDIPHMQTVLTNLEDISLPEANSKIALSQYHKVLATIFRKTGIDFSHYKPNTIQRRIVKRMQLKRLTNLEGYYQLLLKDDQEVKALQQDLLIGVTQFIRDPDAFEQIEKKVIPELFKQKENGEPLRLWVAGCSTGEEAYSMAILLEEYKEANNLHNNYTIFATDIDHRAIKTASQGAYSTALLVDMKVDLVRKYFIQREGQYVIKKEIRNQIVFAQHNLVIDPPFNRLDFISCRNLLIYFNQTLQDKVFSLFQFSLLKGGYLFLGPSESLPKDIGTFLPINKRWRIFQSDANSPVYTPGMFTDFSNKPVVKNPEVTVAAAPEKKYIRAQSFVENQYRDFLQEHGPMVIFTNQYFEVLYLSGGINKILRLPENKLSFSLLKILPEPLRAPINTAVQKALRTKLSVRYQSVPIELDGTPRIAHIKADPITQEDAGYKLILLTLDLRDDIPEASTLEEIKHSNLQQDPLLQIQMLKSSLKDTRDTLMTTIEELETSNEELQASNEEMMTTNEEMQSANEELQSVNEELQSVNEELHTSNSELQVKIMQLTEMTDDMDNLFNSTEICALFLDVNLNIRKFTPAVTNFIGILHQDIGRPLSIFYSEIGTKDLIQKSKLVLESQKEEKMVKELKNNNKVFIRILPYRTESDPVQGVVITLANLNDLSV